MKTASPTAFIYIFGLMFSFSTVVLADMDRWQAMAMRDRYAESNPETLNRPAAEVVVSTSPHTETRPQLAVMKSKVSESLPAAAARVAAASPTIGAATRLSPTVTNLRMAAHQLAAKKLVYDFGSDEVDSGGLDCSATVQYLLTERLGIKGVPRTSYLQYDWLEKRGTLVKLKGKRASDKLLRKLSPGDLIFWGKTWSSGHKVSHVMIYMGWNPTNEKHYVFGARGKKVKGLTGAGVDVFELKPDRGVLVGHGRVPGLKP